MLVLAVSDILWWKAPGIYSNTNRCRLQCIQPCTLRSVCQSSYIAYIGVPDDNDRLVWSVIPNLQNYNIGLRHLGLHIKNNNPIYYTFSYRVWSKNDICLNYCMKKGYNKLEILQSLGGLYVGLAFLPPTGLSRFHVTPRWYRPTL